MTTDPSTDPRRRAAIKLLRRGLVHPAEAAELAKATPQLVQHWIKTEPHLDWRAARRRALAKLWARAYRP